MSKDLWRVIYSGESFTTGMSQVRLMFPYGSMCLSSVYLGLKGILL